MQYSTLPFTLTNSDQPISLTLLRFTHRRKHSTMRAKLVGVVIHLP